MRRLLVWVLLGVAAVAGAFAFRDAQQMAATPHQLAAAVTPATPVLSLRRVPVVLTRVAGDIRLRGALDAILADPTTGTSPGQVCVDVRQAGRIVYQRSAGTQLIPASNMKLLTAFAALTKLGPAYTYTTTVRAASPPAAGVVNGPLYLVGSGDPLLWTNDFAAAYTKADLLPPAVEPRPHTKLEDLADAIVKAGVKQITGGVVGDDSRYDAQRYVPTWSKSYAASGEVGPMGALTVNEGFTSFAPRFVVANDPAVAAAAALTALLQARGVQIGGAPARGAAPAGASLAAVTSPPLQDVITEILRESENDGAEEVGKELGVRFGGGGTTAAGLSAIRAALDGAHLRTAQLTATDASGLDRGDRVSCQLLTDLLETAGPSGPLAAALPVAAKSGTLGKRFVNTPAAGRLRAKTGSLTGVDSLSGFVDQVTGGPPLTFSLLANNLPSDAAGRAVEDRVGQALASWPQAPAASSLDPLPPVPRPAK